MSYRDRDYERTSPALSGAGGGGDFRTYSHLTFFYFGGWTFYPPSISVIALEMEVQEDTVYVSGLPPETTVDNLGELFGSIGVIKVSILIT